MRDLEKLKTEIKDLESEMSIKLADIMEKYEVVLNVRTESTIVNSVVPGHNLNIVNFKIECRID